MSCHFWCLVCFGLNNYQRLCRGCFVNRTSLDWITSLLLLQEEARIKQVIKKRGHVVVLAFWLYRGWQTGLKFKVLKNREKRERYGMVRTNKAV